MKGMDSISSIMVKPIDLLVPVCSIPYGTYTSGLSTSSSTRGLISSVARREGYLILGGASRLDAFSGYPFRT
jgi:hypothetical protein